MRLDIIVPHYKEPWKTCKYLFDTIATQRGIWFNDIRVILVNDGEDVLFGDIGQAMLKLSSYPFAVDYIIKEHGGVSAARNEGLDASDADYVMFCDCDDGFLNNYALYTVFSAMQEGFDMCISNFLEESFDKNGNPTVVTHSDDMTFVHGKVYNRQFMVDNDLRFDDSLTIHEDGYFNMLVYSTVQKLGARFKKISTPIYLWCWNNNSVVRADKEDFALKTYAHIIASRIAICNKQKERGYDEFYKASVCMTVMNAYYDHQKPRYRMAKNARYFAQAEKAFRRFWIEFKPTFYDLTNAYVAEVAEAARSNAVKNGMLLEQETLKEFLKHIEYEVK